MRQGSEGEKVSGKRDKMITVEKHSVWGTDVAVTARSASFGRETALLFVNSTAKTWTLVKSDRMPDENKSMRFMKSYTYALLSEMVYD